MSTLLSNFFGSNPKIRVVKTEMGYAVKVDRQIIQSMSKHDIDLHVDQMCLRLESEEAGCSIERTIKDMHKEILVIPQPTRKEQKAHRKSMQENYLAQHPEPKQRKQHACTTKEDHTFDENFSGIF